MIFLANMGGPSLISDMKMALKRAKHFTSGLSFDGFFSPTGKTGLSIPIRNGLWYIDLVITNPPHDLTLEEDIKGELLCLHWMAKSINKWIDGHLVENDEEAKWALAAWLVRAEAWCDWSKLEDIPVPKVEEPRGITMAAAKFVYKQIINSDKDPSDVVNELDLWMADEWTHVGICCLVCLESQKLVDTYKKGNTKVFDSLVGKCIKMANMTVDPELIRELLPLIIQVHF